MLLTISSQARLQASLTVQSYDNAVRTYFPVYQSYVKQSYSFQTPEEKHTLLTFSEPLSHEVSFFSP